MSKVLLVSALVLSLGAVALPAEARTNVSIGIGINTGPAVAAGYGRGYRRYGEADVRLLLSRQGYRLDFIESRGDAFFVRAALGGVLYQGLIGCDNGAWVSRAPVVYYAPPPPPRYYRPAPYYGTVVVRTGHRDHWDRGHGRREHRARGRRR